MFYFELAPPGGALANRISNFERNWSRRSPLSLNVQAEPLQTAFHTINATQPVWHVVQAKLLEHNVRFGDPECQGLMLRLESDLLEVLLAACDGQLADVHLKWSPDAALTVVMAAEGYPGSYKKGSLIHNLENVSMAKVNFACVSCCQLVRLMVASWCFSSIEQHRKQFAMQACQRHACMSSPC